MSEPNRWLDDASLPRGEAYAARIAALAATGQDMHGEATFVTALPGKMVLDAGCGTGRVAIELARRGYDVVGVDLDPSMLAVARRMAPQVSWYEGDLAIMRSRWQAVCDRDPYYNPHLTRDFPDYSIRT